MINLTSLKRNNNNKHLLIMSWAFKPCLLAWLATTIRHPCAMPSHITCWWWSHICVLHHSNNNIMVEMSMHVMAHINCNWRQVCQCLTSLSDNCFSQVKHPLAQAAYLCWVQHNIFIPEPASNRIAWAWGGRGRNPQLHEFIVFQQCQCSRNILFELLKLLHRCFIHDQKAMMLM